MNPLNKKSFYTISYVQVCLKTAQFWHNLNFKQITGQEIVLFKKSKPEVYWYVRNHLMKQNHPSSRIFL